MSTSNSADISPSPSPINSNNAPKFGTLVPNRIFVGGITANTSEAELYELFSDYGNVKATKIIADRAGVSKGYGFVTFETEEEAKKIQKEESVILKDRKLNIAPAIRKQASFGEPFSRAYGSSESSSERSGTPRQPRNSVDWNVVPPTAAEPAPLVPTNGTVFYHNGASYYSPNGAVYAPAEGAYQYSQPQYYPMVYSPTPVYIQQQFPPYQSPAQAQAQWSGQPLRWATHIGYGQSPSPHASVSSSAAAIPQYMYSTNSCPTTATTNSGQASSSITTTVASMQTHSIGEPCATNAPVATAAIAYSYPPPPILAPYQPQNGSGDVADLPTIEAATSAEQTLQSQDSVGPMMVCNHTGLSAAVHFVRAYPPLVQDSDDYRLPSFEQGTANNRGYRKGHQPNSPRKMQFAYSVPAHYYRPKGKMGNSIYGQSHNNSTGVNIPTSGTPLKKPDGNANNVIAQLTPPSTPLAVTTSINENTPVAEAAHRLKSIKL